jgi:AraC-like DNA-binding protein
MERLAHGEIARHRHAQGYAALVVSGGYVEAGDAGRFRVGAGDVVLHRAFEAHRNGVARTGAVVINVPLDVPADWPNAFRARHPDVLIWAARRDPQAVASLLEPGDVVLPAADDWVDLLAGALNRDPALLLGPWAQRHGLRPEALSRGFVAAFGVTPARYRLEARTRQAVAALRAAAAPIAAIALEHGFADQAHFSRSVRALTGCTPKALSHRPSVQDHRKLVQDK